MRKLPPAHRAFLSAFHRAVSGWTFESDGILWRQVGRSTVMTVPASVPFPMGRSEADRALRASGCAIAQFATEAPTGVTCLRYVLRDRSYSEASLQKQFRQMLRRSRERLSFRPLDWNELATQGPRVLDASKARHGVPSRVRADIWREACALGAATGDVGALGCLDGDTLAGFAIFLELDGGRMVIHSSVDPAYFPVGAANLLLFEGARYLIGQPGCAFVSYGHSGFPEMTTVGRFKRHAGLGEEPMRVAFLLHPRWRWLRGVERATRGFTTLGRIAARQRRLADPLAGIGAAAATDPALLPA